MQLRKYRWSKAYESAEEELVEMLAAKQIPALRWAAEEDAELPTRQHDFDMHLWCAEGQLLVTAADKMYSLQPGDTLEIPANTDYDILVRFGGCVCYEAPSH
jgi:quercetin dioxygenase-like cupin family protein